MSMQNSELDISFMKGIVISTQSGEFLLDFLLTDDINPILLSSFVGALSLFGKDSLGKIEEITIKGLDLVMVIVNKYNLILVIILDKNYMSEHLRDDAEKLLDWFNLLYKKDIEKHITTDVFDSFKNILLVQIQEYAEKIRENDIEDFGFFTKAIEKFRK